MRLSLRASFQTLAQFALIALLIRALIPAGWMPAADGSLGQLVFCTAHGTVERGADNGWPSDPSPKSPNDVPCAFTALGSLSVPESYIDLARSKLAVTESWFTPDSRASHLYDRHTASARGPPRSA